jgi:hypothetical protein
MNLVRGCTSTSNTERWCGTHAEHRRPPPPALWATATAGLRAGGHPAFWFNSVTVRHLLGSFVVFLAAVVL